MLKPNFVSFLIEYHFFIMLTIIICMYIPKKQTTIIISQRRIAPGDILISNGSELGKIASFTTPRKTILTI